jgi:hypothetical protein
MAGKKSIAPLALIKIDSLKDWIEHVKKNQKTKGTSGIAAATELASAEQYYNKHVEHNVPFNKDVWNNMYRADGRAFDITDFGQDHNRKLSPNELMKRIRWAQVDTTPGSMYLRIANKYGASGKEIIKHITGHPYSFYALGDDAVEDIRNSKEYTEAFDQAIKSGDVNPDMVDEAAYNARQAAQEAENVDIGNQWINEAVDINIDTNQNKQLSERWANDLNDPDINFDMDLQASEKSAVNNLIADGYLRKNADGSYETTTPGAEKKTSTKLFFSDPDKPIRVSAPMGTADYTAGHPGAEVLIGGGFSGNEMELADYIRLSQTEKHPEAFAEPSTDVRSQQVIVDQLTGQNFNDLSFNDQFAVRNMYANGSLSVLDDGSIVAYNPNVPAGKPLISFNQSADFETLKGPMAPKGSSKLRKLTLAGLGVLGGGAAEAAEAGLMIGEKAGLGFGESVAATGAGLGAIKYTMPTVWNTIKKVASRVATPWAVSDLVLGGMNAENAMVRRQNPEEMGVNSYMRNMGVLRPEAQKEFGNMQQSYLSGGATKYNYDLFNPEQTYGPRETWSTYGNKMLNEDGSGKDVLDYVKQPFFGGA